MQTSPGKVTILLLFLMICGTLYAQEGSFQVFEFRCEFQMPIASGRVDGLIARDGCRQRIAIYWMEPAMFREAPSFLRCCDLIFDRDVVHYWIQGMSQPGTFHWSGGEESSLLPRQKGPESILRSALAIVGRIRCFDDETETPLRVAAFFAGSRSQDQFQYAVTPNEVDRSPSFDDTSDEVHLLNVLPFGREYLKETQDDGAVVWRSRKAASGSPIATLTVRRAREFAQDAAQEALDERTLGRWALIPEAYRAYWSFDRDLAELNASSEARTSSRELYDRLSSCLAQSNISPDVGRALDRLRFQVALMTADSNCVWQSAGALVTGLCEDEVVPKQQCILELGSMSERIQKRYCERMEEQLRPLVEHVVRHAGRDISARTDQLMEDITRNGWFAYGELLLAEMGRTGLMRECDVDLWTIKLRTSRLAKNAAVSDLSDEPPSVRQYLSRLDAPPPKGVMDWNDVRYTLNEGLAKRYASEQSEAKREMVESVIRLIRLVGGDGPFSGVPERLIPSLDHFSYNCLQRGKSPGSFDTVLATLLVLSFCDTSTTEDHELLIRQFQHCSHDLQAYVNSMLATHALTSLVAPEDVEHAFRVYETAFRGYVDDPLCPALKFPWTRDEEGRLDATVRLRLAQLKSVFEEMSLKVKYGGASEELKDKVVCAISTSAQELLPQAAFLRAPPYPGVFCWYYTGSGFSVAITDPLYQEANRPTEKFKAMKYFHLGHRLQEVVKRERELVRHDQRQEQTQ